MMLEPYVKMPDRPQLRNTRLVMGFSGWMDGGEVSTGTIDYLISKIQATKFAEIEPREFYVHSFPGSMAVASLCRPHAAIEDGLVTTCTDPAIEFFDSENHDLILFRGKEPNMGWEQFAESVFGLATEFDVTRIYFVGSISGMAPHTREPRFFGSVSDESIKPLLHHYGLRPSNYEGPAGISTYLMKVAREKGIEMISFVAETPSYIQGRNIKCIESMVRKVVSALGLGVKLDDLKLMSDQFDKKLVEAVSEQSELAELIRKMENDYDREVLDTEMPDLKAWLERQNIRLD